MGRHIMQWSCANIITEELKARKCQEYKKGITVGVRPVHDIPTRKIPRYK
jgi:hypothetical protein